VHDLCIAYLCNGVQVFILKYEKVQFRKTAVKVQCSEFAKSTNKKSSQIHQLDIKLQYQNLYPAQRNLGGPEIHRLLELASWWK
jgi:hypothetical protein